MQSGFKALLLAVVLFSSLSWLANSQVESMASENTYSCNISANTSVELRQNVTIEGDIVVDSGTYLIENVNLNLTGKIIASNDAAVIIRNATLFVTTQGYTFFRDGIILANSSKLIVENATVFLDSANTGEESYITVGDESTANITDSELYGIAFVIGRQNSRTFVNRSALKGPSPADLDVFDVITEDNATARIQDSELDGAGARGDSSVYILNSIVQTTGVSTAGNGLIEIEDSTVGSCQWLWDNSTLRVLNSTIDLISFQGFTLTVKDSRVVYDLAVYGNSTAWLTNISTSRLTARGNSAVWLINSYAKVIDAREQGEVYVGWQLPLLGIIAFPHTWLPILQGLAFLAAVIMIIALLVVLNRRWKRRRWKKSIEEVLFSDSAKSS